MCLLILLQVSHRRGMLRTVEVEKSIFLSKGLQQQRFAPQYHKDTVWYNISLITTFGGCCLKYCQQDVVDCYPLHGECFV
jgi:hypothetical protein